MVAVSVDAPETSEALRVQLSLPFRILCDTERRVVRDWDLYDARERGGIAKPAVFVIDPNRARLGRLGSQSRPSRRDCFPAPKCRQHPGDSTQSLHSPIFAVGRGYPEQLSLTVLFPASYRNGALVAFLSSGKPNSDSGTP